MTRKSVLIQTIFALGLMTGLAERSAIAEVPSAVAIKDAHVVSVSGTDLQKGTVLLRDGLIEAIGTDVTIPADAWVIDGKGLTVYPGFIDGLSTWGIPPSPPAGSTGAQPAVAAASNATTTQQAQAPRAHGPEDRPQTYSYERAADLVAPGDSRLEIARAAGFTTAATFPNRGIVEGLGAMVDLAGERGRDMVVAQPIGQQIVFRTGGGGLGRSFPASLMGNIAYVRQLFLDLGQYKEAKQIYAAGSAGKKRPEYDHDLEGLAESPRLLLPADEAQQIDRMLSFGQELKTPFVLYGLHESYKRVDELKKANVPVLLSLKWPEKPKEADPSDIPNYRDLEMRAEAPKAAAMLEKAGVKIAFFSDGIATAPELRKAIKKAVDAGLPRAEAVRALTLNVAEMYGVADRLGSLEKGKIANLVVMKGEAFEEGSNIEYVFVDGKEFQPSKETQQGPESGAGKGKPTDAEKASDGGKQ